MTSPIASPAASPITASSWYKLFFNCWYTSLFVVPIAASPRPKHPPCLTVCLKFKKHLE